MNVDRDYLAVAAYLSEEVEDRDLPSDIERFTRKTDWLGISVASCGQSSRGQVDTAVLFD